MQLATTWGSETVAHVYTGFKSKNRETCCKRAVTGSNAQKRVHQLLRKVNRLVLSTAINAASYATILTTARRVTRRNDSSACRDLLYKKLLPRKIKGTIGVF